MRVTETPRAPLLAQANGKVAQKGAVADYLEVDHGYERAVEACLADLLQHVIVERPEHAAAGFGLVREAGAGRCGFLIAAPQAAEASTVPWGRTEAAPPEGVVALSSVVRVSGAYGGAIQRAIGDAWIADSYDRAAQSSGLTVLPVVTPDGDVFRGPHLVSGGTPRGGPGHSRDQGRNQGTARPDPGSARDPRRPRG